MEHQNGIIIGFIVRVSGVNTEEVIERTVTQFSNEVFELHPFYSYRFSVAAETIAPGPFSNPITLQLPESGIYIINLSMYVVYNEIFISFSSVSRC